MGRPPHAGRFSISFRTSRKAALLFLQWGAQSHSDSGKRWGGQVGGTCVGRLGVQRPHSQQLLQGTLLIDLVGAVGDVREEMMLSVVLQDVTDVLHTHLSFVPLLQGFKEPVAASKRGVGGEVKAPF